MYPNPPTQPGQQIPPPQPEYGIDYLNQIAAPVKRSVVPSPLVLAGIVGTGLLIIVGFALIVFNSAPSAVDKAAALKVRLTSLQQLASTSQQTLRDNDLRSTNAAFTLYLSNTLRDINDPVTAMGASAEAVVKPITATEAAHIKDIQTKFEEAKLNVMFDRTYAREMAYQIGVLGTMMTGVYKTTTSVSLKKALETSTASLEQSLESFQTFAGAS